ncbi:10910_t:CDS:2, partial [Entrophospora sp. SA101]
MWASPNYINKNRNINGCSWCDDLISPIIFFCHLMLTRTLLGWRNSQSIKKRNGEIDPSWYPDYMWYLVVENSYYLFEVFFREVSYGPRAKGSSLIKHINNDRSRLAKMAKESWNKGSKQPTLHLVIPWYKALLDHCQVITSDNEITKKIKLVVAEKLIEKIKIHELHKLAIFFNHLMKKLKILESGDSTW